MFPMILIATAGVHTYGFFFAFYCIFPRGTVFLSEQSLARSIS